MRVRNLPVGLLIEAVVLFAVRSTLTPRGYFKTLLSPVPGRSQLSADERRMALTLDAGLRRLHVRCLWRAAVVSELLRRRGVEARIRLSVARDHPQTAHAECEVGGATLRPQHPRAIVLR